MSQELVGTVVNNYQLQALIGEGGMGTVYLGAHTFIGRKVAVKVLRRVYSEDPEMVARFMNEARAANAIGHPNIIDIIDVGRLEDGLPYLMMEHLEGETLAARLQRERKLPLLDAVAIIKQTTAALAAAHAAGIIHRDLKPENIFLSVDGLGQQRVKVLDFGIAKLRDVAGANPVETSSGLMGTPIYMSPEQCRGGSVEVDARADVYAVGTLLYEMLCGEVPFAGAASGEVLVMHLTVPPRPPRSLNPDIPAPVEAVMERALAKSPDERPQDMESLQRALDEALIWPPAVARSLTPLPLPAPATAAPHTPTPATVVLSVDNLLAHPTPSATATATASPSPSPSPSPSESEALPATETTTTTTTTTPAPASLTPLPAWVITTPPLSTPQTRPFSDLLARPKPRPVVAIGAVLAAGALALFAFAPWQPGVARPQAEVSAPPAPTTPPAPTPVAPARAARPAAARALASQTPTLAAAAAPAVPRAATEPAERKRAKVRRKARRLRARAARQAAPAPDFMGKW